MEILLVALVVTSIGISTALHNGPLLSNSNDQNLKVTAYYSCCSSSKRKITFSNIKIGDKYIEQNTKLAFQINYANGAVRVYTAYAEKIKSTRSYPLWRNNKGRHITSVSIRVWLYNVILSSRPGGKYAASTPAMTAPSDGPLFSASSDKNLAVTAYYSCCSSNKITFSNINIGAQYIDQNTKVAFVMVYARKNGGYHHRIYKGNAQVFASKRTIELEIARGYSEKDMRRVLIRVWDPKAKYSSRILSSRSSQGFPDGALYPVYSDKDKQVTASFSSTSKTITFSEISIADDVCKKHSKLYLVIMYKEKTKKTPRTISGSCSYFGKKITLKVSVTDMDFVAIGTPGKIQGIDALATRPSTYMTPGPLRVIRKVAIGPGKAKIPATTTGTYTTYFSSEGKNKGKHVIRIKNFKTEYTGRSIAFFIGYKNTGVMTEHKKISRKDFTKGHVEFPLKYGKRDKDVHVISVYVWPMGRLVQIAKRDSIL